jgi:hypothetical protein
VGSVIRPLAVAVSIATIGPACQAQVTLGLEPVGSYYLPLGYFRPADLFSTALPRRPSDLRGPAWGGNIQLTFQRRFAIEGLAQTTTHTLPSCLCPGGPTGPSSVRVRIAALVAQYDLSIQPRYDLWASLGPAIIRHSGRGYEQPDSPVSWGGEVGLELAIRLSSHWQLVTGATGIGYSFNVDFPPQHGPQLDALLSLGVRWHS